MPSVKLDLPAIRLELVEELPAGPQDGFLRLVRRRYRAHYPDGSVSRPFVYDAVDRRAVDAVVIAAHHAPGRHRAGGRWVYLRSAVRPPLLLRGQSRALPGEPPRHGGLWELPAGLVEEEELGRPEGTRESAQRELAEELGFRVDMGRLRPLGRAVFPTPGLCAEKHHYFEVEVDPKERGEPMLDGSALERSGRIVALDLREALQLCASGAIEDGKTELGLRRLLEKYG